MTKTLNINSKEASIKKRNIRVYNDNLRIILKEGGNYHCDSGTAGYIERDGMLQSGTIMYDKPFSVADVPCDSHLRPTLLFFTDGGFLSGYRILFSLQAMQSRRLRTALK